MAEKQKQPKKTDKSQSKKKVSKAGREKAAPAIAISDGKEVAHAVPRLKKVYAEKVVPAMMKRHDLKNPMSVPRLEKIVVNVGVSEAKDNIQMLETCREEIAVITGQWPQIRRAIKSISNYKLRQGNPIGVRVTLRGHRMYEFLDRLISTAIPRIRDFRGLRVSAFDGTGNYNLGLKEQMIFPEINTEKTTLQRGMNISIVTNATSNEISMDMLRSLGMPFQKEKASAS